MPSFWLSRLLSYGIQLIWTAIQVLNEEGISVPEENLAHVSPLGWEHITITGTYHWKRVDRP